jgi:hypothetical protein
MAEKVIVKGGGTLDGAQFDNAASEETLKSLLKAVKDLSGSSAASGKNSSDQVIKYFNQSLKGNAKALDDNTNKHEVFQGILGKTGEKAKDLGSSMASAATSIIGAGLGVAFGLIASGSMKLVGVFTEGLDAWREVSSVGAGFNNNLMDLQRSAAAAHMPLDTFVSVIKSNSGVMANLGGTVTQGAKMFGDMSKSLTDVGGTGGKLFALGYTAKDVTEGLASYLDIQSKSGRLVGKSQKELTDGASAYLEQMDGLAKATGISRKQQEDAAKKASVDPMIKALQRGLDDKQLANANANLAQMVDAGGQEFADAMKSMAAGVPDKMGKEILATTKMTMEDAKKMFQGMAPDEARKKMLEMGKAFRASGIGDNAAILSKRFGALSNVSDNLLSAEKRNTEEGKKEQAKQNAITKGMASFGQVWTDITSSIKNSLFNSGIFARLENTFEKLMEIFNNNSGKIGDFFGSLIDGIDANLEKGDIVGAFSSVFSRVAEFLKPILSEIFKKLFESPDNKKKREGLESKRAEIQKNLSSGKMGSESARDSANEEIENLNKQLSELDSDPMKMIKESLKSAIPGFETLEKILDKVDWAFNNLGTVLGVGSAVIVGLTAMSSLIGGAGSGLGGAISGLSKGIGDMIANIGKGLGAGISGLLSSMATGLAAISAPPVLIGLGAVTLAMIGIGAALNLAAPGIEALSPILTKVADVIGGIVVKAFQTLETIAKTFLEGFKAIPDVFERLANIGATNLISTSVGIAAVGAALVVFAAGGALASLVSGTGLIDLSNGLKALGEVNGEMLAKLAPSLDAISKPLAVLGGSSVLALIGGNGLGQLATGLKAFEEIDPTKIANVGPALEGLHKALSLFTGGNEGLFASIGSAIGNFVKGDSGVGKLAESFKSFNSVDGANLNNVATGMATLRTGIGDDLAKQADGVKVFADSIKNLSDKMKDLQTSLEKLNKTPGGAGAVSSTASAAPTAGSSGGTGDSTSSSADKLDKLNILVTELVSVNKEIRGFEKDLVDAVKGRNSAMGGK